MTCQVCFHQCRLSQGQTGLCHARQNLEGQIVSTNYGHVTALHLDPTEKKPFSHFYPGTKILSVGSFGCNLRCPFCQNAAIALAEKDTISTQFFSPQQVIEEAIRLVPFGNIGVAFTYNEPMIGYEFVRDTAQLAKMSGLTTAVVTNGTVSTAVLEEVLPYIDGFNIDLKGFTPAYYHWLGGDLASVKAFVETAVSTAHVELTTLIVPGKNDSLEEMEALSTWVASLGSDIPLHLSRFFPGYQYTASAPTPIDTLLLLKDVAKKHLRFVRLGNV